MIEWLIKRIVDLSARRYTGKVVIHFHCGCVAAVEKLDKEFSDSFKVAKKSIN